MPSHRLRRCSRAPPRARRERRLPVRRGGHRRGLRHRRRPASPGARPPREVERLRAAYAQAGYGHGHRVGLLLENRPAFFAPLARAQRARRQRRADQRRHALGRAELPHRPQRDRAGGDAAGARGRRCARRRPQAGAALATIRPDRRGPHRRRRARRRASSREPIGRDTECALLYTSGTTGRPKGCLLANELLPARRRVVRRRSASLCEVRPDVERIITPLPLSHMNAMAFSTMAVLLSGGCLVQLDRFHPTTWWQSVRDSARDDRALPRRDAGDAAGGAAVARRPRARACASASAPASIARHHAPFEERFGFPLLEAWAMTETGAGAPASWRNREPRHVGTSCFGRADARSSRCASSTTQGSDVAVDAPGELLVRAAGRRPARATSSSATSRTRRRPRRPGPAAGSTPATSCGATPTGNFYFVDRKKNVIRRSGENISAVEVESVLNQHPAVAACGVAATPDAVRGDEVLACIVLRKPASRRRAATHRARASSEHALDAARLLQGAGLRRLRRCAAAHAVAEDPARRAARAGARACRASRTASTRAR